MIQTIKKSVSILLSIVMILSLFTIVPVTAIEREDLADTSAESPVAVGSDNKYIVSGADLAGWYSYRNRDTNMIEDCYTTLDGISVHYSGGRDYMQSGLYNSIDGGKKNLLMNSKTSTLTFTSEYTDRPIKGVRIYFQELPKQMIYALQNDPENISGDVKVNNGRWSRYMYISDYTLYTVGHEQVEYYMYALDMTGPPALSVSLHNVYHSFEFYIMDIVRIEFTYADPYEYTAEEGIFGDYAEDGGFRFSSWDPFVVKNGDEVVCVSHKNEKDRYIADLLDDPTGKTFSAVHAQDSVVVKTEKAFRDALAEDADYIKKIVLGADIECQSGFTVPKEVTIDLNGHTLSLNSEAGEQKIVVPNGKTSTSAGPMVTFTDSSENQEGLLTGFQCVDTSINDGVTFHGGHFDLPGGTPGFSYRYTKFETGFYRIYDTWRVNANMVLPGYKTREADGWVEVYPHAHTLVENDRLNADGSIELNAGVCTTCGDVFEGYTLSPEMVDLLVKELPNWFEWDPENNMVYYSMYCYWVNYADMEEKYAGRDDILTAVYQVYFSPVLIAIPATRLGDCGDMLATCRIGTKDYSEMYAADESILENPTWSWDENNVATLSATCPICHHEYHAPVFSSSSYITKEPTLSEEGEMHYDAEARINGVSYNSSHTAVLPKLSLTYHAAVPHTCTQDGNIEYWYDAYYDWYFADSEGSNKITDIVDPKAHDYTHAWSWTDDNTATVTFTCGVCNDVQTADATVTSQQVDAKPDRQGTITYTAEAEFEGKQYSDVKTVNFDWTCEKVEANAPTYYTYGNIEYFFGSDHCYYLYDSNTGTYYEVNYDRDIELDKLHYDVVDLSEVSYLKYDQPFSAYGNGSSISIYSSVTGSAKKLNHDDIYKFTYSINGSNYSINIINASTNQVISVLYSGTLADGDDLKSNVKITHPGNYNAVEPVVVNKYAASETFVTTEAGTARYDGANAYLTCGEEEYAGGTYVDPPMTVTTYNGIRIDKVIYRLDYRSADEDFAKVDHGDLSVSDNGYTVTVTNVDSSSISISDDNDEYFQVKSVEVYYRTDYYAKVEAKAATKTADGNTEYYIGIGRYYKFENGSYVEIPEDSWIIPAENNITAKVSATDWVFAGPCDTAFAPAVTTADGRTVNMYQGYEMDASNPSLTIYQDITGLPIGRYKIILYANTCYTPGRGFDTDINEGDTDVVYVFANDVKKSVPAMFAESVRTNGEYELTVTVTEADNGLLRIGLQKVKAGTNWHTIQIKKLEKLLTYDKVAAKPATDAEDGNTEYYTGSDGNFYKYENGSFVRIAQDSWIIPATGSTVERIATATKDIKKYSGTNADVSTNAANVRDIGIRLIRPSTVNVTAKNDQKLLKVTFHVYESSRDNSRNAVANKGTVTVSNDGSLIIVSNIGSDSVSLSMPSNSIWIDWVEVQTAEIPVTYTFIPAKDATFSENGNIAYYAGSNGKYYLLENDKYVEVAQSDCIILSAVAAFNASTEANPVLQLNEDISGIVTVTRNDGVFEMNGHRLDGTLLIQNNDAAKSFTVKNGSISDIDGNWGFDDAYEGTIVFENTTITGTLWTDGHPIVINSGTFNSINCYKCDPAKEVSMTISGGMFNGVITNGGTLMNGFVVFDNGRYSVTVTGGNFTFDPSDYVAEGYSATKEGSYWYVSKNQPAIVELTHFDASAASCTTDGNIEYWYNSDTYQYFTDANGEHEISYESTVISALGHDWGEWTVNPENNKEEIRACHRCGETQTRDKDIQSCNETLITNTMKSVYSGENFRVTVDSVGDSDGFNLRSDDKAVIKADSGKIITLVVLTVGYYESNAGSTVSSDGDVDAQDDVETITISNLYTDRLTVYNTEVLQIKAVQVFCVDGGEAVTLTHHGASAATCTLDGNIEYWYDEEHDEYFSDAEGKNEISRNDVIIPSGHNWSAWTMTHEPTCTEDGEETRTCSRCGETQTSSIWASGHDWGAWTVNPDNDKEEIRTCDRCGAAETRSLSGEDEQSETLDTNTRQSEYIGESFTVTVDDGGDSDGFWLRDDSFAIIQSNDGKPISKIVLTIGCYEFLAESITASVGSIEAQNDVDTITITNIGSDTVILGSNELLQIKTVQVFFGNGGNASGANETIETNHNESFYSGINADVTCDPGDSDGAFVANNRRMTVTAKNGKTISKIVFNVGFYEFYSRYANADKGVVTVSDDGWTITVDNINDTSVSLGSDDSFQIKSIIVYYADNGGNEAELTHVAAVAPNCTESGNIEYWYDEETGTYYADANGENEITHADTVIAANGHTFGDWIVTKEPQVGVKGEETHTCSACGERETRESAALPYVPTENEDGTIVFNETVTEEPKDVTELFAQAKEESGTVEIKATTEDDQELVIVFDADAVSAIGDSQVSLSAKVSTENLTVEDAEMVLEITLSGATFAEGEATVSIPFESEAPEGKVAKVYYIADDGTRTDMNATFENGMVTFTTNHFSNYAVIFEDVQNYTVTWKNYDGTVLETDEDVENGTIPTYNGETPTKASDDAYYYIFAGWDKEITAVTGDVTYTATFTAKAKGENILGDADGDGEITILDATLIQRYLADYTVKDPERVATLGNVSGGGISIIDATLIQRYLAGFTVPYPIGEPVQ